MKAQYVDTRQWLAACAAGALLVATAPAPGQPQLQPQSIEEARLQVIEEAARADQLREILQQRGLREDRIRITDFEGRDRTRELLAPEAAEREPPRLAERQVVVRPAEVITMRLPAERSDLPGGVAQVEEATPEISAAEGWFHPSLIASPTPAVWDRALRRYTTRLSFGLRGENVPPGTDLEQPVTVQLGFRGLAADPVEQITLQQPGIEHEKHVDFRFIPTTERPVLEMRSTIVDVDFEIEAMPRIELHPERGHMTGLGLDNISVNVLRLRPHGLPAPAPADEVVTVEVSGPAIADTGRIAFPAGSSEAEFTLRSRGLDDVSVVVTAGPYMDSRTIEQRFPFGPLGAVLIGGAVGGFARRFAQSGAGASAGLRIIEGLMVAVVAFVAGVLGVGFLNLPAVVVATEAGAFLTGALTGFVGVTIIEALGKRLAAAPG